MSTYGVGLIWTTPMLSLLTCFIVFKIVVVVVLGNYVIFKNAISVSLQRKKTSRRRSTCKTPETENHFHCCSSEPYFSACSPGNPQVFQMSAPAEWASLLRSMCLRRSLWSEDFLNNSGPNKWLQIVLKARKHTWQVIKEKTNLSFT